MYLENLIRDSKDKEFSVIIKHKNMAPQIVVTIDGEEHKGKVIHNEIVWEVKR